MSVEAAQVHLRQAAEKLRDVLAESTHDLWEGDRLNVAPTRFDAVDRLRSKGVRAWDSHDLDFVMFKCMTTMGGEQTFRSVLPRFLLAVADSPFEGWTVESHVLLSKAQLASLANWRPTQLEALSEALVAFACLERAIEQEGGLEASANSDADELEKFAMSLIAG